MKKDINKTKLLSDDGKIMSSKKDNAEISLAFISREFKKNVRIKAASVKKTVKMMLCKELSQVRQNSERLLHGKA